MFHFVANLKPYTFHRGRGIKRFDAYLLSIDFANQKNRLAKKVVADRKQFCLDNGNVDHISDFVTQFKDEAKPIHQQRAQFEDQLDRKVRPGELPDNIQKSYQKLAEKITGEALLATDDAKAVNAIEQQLSFSPTYLIGMEDFSLPAILANNIERQYSGLPLDWYHPIIDRVIHFAQHTQSRAEKHNAEIFTGVHALDFDTANMAGKRVGQAGLASIASGVAGAMRDKTFAEYRVENNQLIEFKDSAPRPYIRVMEIIAGFHIGFAEATRKRLKFHALGLGTPILLPLLGLFSSSSSGFTAVDSTAPIKDAFASTIRMYVDTPAPRKLKAFRIVEFWLSHGIPWDCKCPYCKKFNQQHSPDLQSAQAWWKSEGFRKLNVDDMDAPSPLADLIPLLGNASAPQIRTQASMTRIMHNHWVLGRIEASIRRHGANHETLRAWVKEIMEIYLDLKGSNANWKQAAEIAWKISDEKSTELSQMVNG